MTGTDRDNAHRESVYEGLRHDEHEAKRRFYDYPMNTPDKAPLRIIQLSVDNIKRLKAVRITPEGHLVVVGGLNDQGKTSVLDSIAMALGGGDEIPSMPVRQGEEKANVIADLGDIVIERTFTAAGGTNLVVKNKDGAKYPAPQAMLDKLTGKLTFDPFEFVRLDPKKRLVALQQLVGLDFKDLDGQRAGVFSQRTDVNRDLQRAKNVATSLPKHDNVPEAEISVVEITAQIEAVNQRNAKHTADSAEQRRQLDLAETSVNSATSDLEQLVESGMAIQQQIKALQTKLAQTETAIGEQKRLLETAKASYDTKKAAHQPATNEDTTLLRDRIGAAETVNRQIRDNKAKATANAEVVTLQAKADTLTKKLEAIDQQKQEQLTAAKFPIDGLSFNEHGVLFTGIPFEQASSAAQLRISVAMAAALNPKLGVMLVRDGSLLDENSLKLLAELAEAKNLQVWVERVSQGAECQVIIEDGEVAQPSHKTNMGLPGLGR